MGTALRYLTVGSILMLTACASGSGGDGETPGSGGLPKVSVRVSEYYSTDPLVVDGGPGWADPNTGELTFRWTLTDRLDSGAISEGKCVMAWKWKDRGYSDLRDLGTVRLNQTNTESIDVGSDVELVEEVLIECTSTMTNADLAQLIT